MNNLKIYPDPDQSPKTCPDGSPRPIVLTRANAIVELNGQRINEVTKISFGLDANEKTSFFATATITLLVKKVDIDGLVEVEIKQKD